MPDDPLEREVRARWLHAGGVARRLQEQYDLEAGNERWVAKRDELRNQKETYENLEQIRRLKFAQADQRGEFLDEFGINHPDIAGIGDDAISALLSNGVETAADITEERLGRIPGLNESRAKRLLRWRQELEQKFEFEPDRCVTPQSRIAIEKEIDFLRRHLERDLSGGAYCLHQVKQKIEANRRKLQPALLKAHRELAQAEMDWEAVIKRNSYKPVLLALIIAFIIGLLLH
jgi:DNA-binding helix-hairpin-helix protein with protein kinase domain